METATTINEDKTYKPSSPDKPQRRFLIEAGAYRWEVYVSRYEIRETGTPVYYAVAEEGHSAYGLTVNEAVNDIAGIMRLRLAGTYVKKVALADVRHYLDPASCEREEMKAAEAASRRPLLERLFLGVRG